MLRSHDQPLVGVCVRVMVCLVVLDLVALLRLPHLLCLLVSMLVLPATGLVGTVVVSLPDVLLPEGQNVDVFDFESDHPGHLSDELIEVDFPAGCMLGIHPVGWAWCVIVIVCHAIAIADGGRVGGVLDHGLCLAWIHVSVSVLLGWWSGMYVCIR